MIMPRRRTPLCFLLHVVVGILLTAVVTVDSFHLQHQLTGRRSDALLLDVASKKQLNTDDSSDDGGFTSSGSDGVSYDRRAMITSSAATAGAAALFAVTTLSNPLPAEAAVTTTTTTTPISASWTAIDGLNSNDDKFVAFDEGAYKAMRDDKSRTPLFKEAIYKRLGSNPENSQTVLDLGTGPYALFAIIAAELGAKKVYAIEANTQAAESARTYIKKSGYDDIIEVIEGFSNQIVLPEKVDFIIAEIIGSISSEENVVATIKDAHSRFVKEPTLSQNWIPCQVQTYGAPASYTLHNLLGPPEFDWNKLNGEPIRFNCRDRGLNLLSDPILIENIDFATINDPKQKVGTNKSIKFTVDKNRVEDNQFVFYDEFRRDKKNSVPESERLAEETSHSFSGIALWPRLVLSKEDNDNIIIDSRHYGDGGHQKSHWQTVLPIMSGRPIPIIEGEGGDTTISVTCDFNLPSDVTKTPTYSIRGQVESG